MPEHALLEVGHEPAAPAVDVPLVSGAQKDTSRLSHRLSEVVMRCELLEQAQGGLASTLDDNERVVADLLAAFSQRLDRVENQVAGIRWRTRWYQFWRSRRPE